MNNLKSLRLHRELTQVEAAKLLGINSVIYCRIERGWYARPPKSLDAKLRAVFGPEWNFEALMRPAPLPHTSTTDNAA